MYAQIFVGCPLAVLQYMSSLVASLSPRTKGITTGIFFIVMLEIIGFYSMPVQHVPAWNSPCNGDSEVSGPRHAPAVTPPPVSLLTCLRSIAELSSQAKRYTQALISEYRKIFQNDNFLDEDLRNTDLSTYGMPVVQTFNASLMNYSVDFALNETYDQLARIAVFLEKVRKTRLEYFVEYNRLFLHVTSDLLCWVYQATSSVGVPYPGTITRDIIHPDLHNITRPADINVHDFLVLRDTSAILNYTVEKYTFLHRQVSSLENDLTR